MMILYNDVYSSIANISKSNIHLILFLHMRKRWNPYVVCGNLYKINKWMEVYWEYLNLFLFLKIGYSVFQIKYTDLGFNMI